MPPEGRQPPGALYQCVQDAVSDYLATMDDQPVNDLHELVVGEVEASMLKCVMHHTGNNQSRAADILGLSRGTLRTKLRKYRLP